MGNNTLLNDLGYSEELYTAEQVVEESAIHDINAELSDVAATAKASLNFLAGLCMPLVFKYLYPPVFLSVWEWLCQNVNTIRAFPQLALGLPRGFGKTTLIKIFVLYCILFTSKKFILIISNTAHLAESIVSDIADILNERNIKTVFGDWRIGIEKDTQELKKFGFRGRNITLACIGVGGSLRGLNIKNERPDVMIFEDIQSREDADSKTVSDGIETWMYGTAMKAKSPHGCMFLFVANMYPTKYSLLRKLKENRTWIKFIAGGILATGESLWEDLQPIEQLLQEYENDLIAGHPEIFYSEVLNDETANTNTRCDIANLPKWRFTAEEYSAGDFIVVDPSGDKQTSDECSIGYFKIFDTVPCMVELIEGRFSPGDTIRNVLTLALTNNCRTVVIESNAYQATLAYWCKFLCIQMEITGIDFLEIYSGMASKISRILKMFTSLEKGEIFYHPETAAKVNMQITQFNPLKRDNTDGILDLLTYAPKVVDMYGEYITSQGVIESQEWRAAKTLNFNSPF